MTMKLLLRLPNIVILANIYWVLTNCLIFPKLFPYMNSIKPCNKAKRLLLPISTQERLCILPRAAQQVRGRTRIWTQDPSSEACPLSDSFKSSHNSDPKRCSPTPNSTHLQLTFHQLFPRKIDHPPPESKYFIDQIEIITITSSKGYGESQIRSFSHSSNIYWAPTICQALLKCWVCSITTPVFHLKPKPTAAK